ncbi:DeoR family transcriptional regulator [Streptomyces sp. NPDC058045]|uniref:DeoR family transcriptional regulator n=1 Tax=Streptomyces sp. NPDC058045 TaxID=3346311 RepID=UPI0036E861BE
MSVLSIEVRRIIVAHLTDLHMSTADIAAELGVSRETVRRDLLARPTATEEDPAPDEAPGEADTPPDPAPRAAPWLRTGPEGLTLTPTDQLGQDIRTIESATGQPAEEIVPHLVRQHAAHILARWSAKTTGTMETCTSPSSSTSTPHRPPPESPQPHSGHGSGEAYSRTTATTSPAALSSTSMNSTTT